VKYIEFDAKKPLYRKPLYWNLKARGTLLSPSDGMWNATCAILEALGEEDINE